MVNPLDSRGPTFEELLKRLSFIIFTCVKQYDYKDGAFAELITETTPPSEIFDLFIASPLLDDKEKDHMKSLKYAPAEQIKDAFWARGVQMAAMSLEMDFQKDLAKRTGGDPVEMFPAENPNQAMLAALKKNGQEYSKEYADLLSSGRAIPRSKFVESVIPMSELYDGMTLKTRWEMVHLEMARDKGENKPRCFADFISSHLRENVSGVIDKLNFKGGVFKGVITEDTPMLECLNIMIASPHE